MLEQLLELLGKADNIPFNQLYSLAEHYADRYYTKVIKTLTQPLKCSFNDRQIVLVNTARALKFLESYGKRQTKLWKVFSKYDKLPDHSHDLQTTLQTEFNLLKKAISKNVKNLHDAINLQQTYTTSLCSHVKTIYTKLMQLDKQIRTHCLYLHPQTDSVQINTPEYDSDIDGQTDTLPDIQPQVPSHAKKSEEDSVPVTANSKEYPALPQDSDRFESQPESAQNPVEYSLHQDAEQSRGHPSSRCKFSTELTENFQNFNCSYDIKALRLNILTRNNTLKLLPLLLFLPEVFLHCY